MPFSDLLTANRDLILFIYGQAFFIMGVAIAFQSRRYSRLDLARSLTWLAAFGLIHGLYEWGDIFIPIQARFVAEALTRLMQLTHLFMLGASFACLLEFGTSLIRTFLSPHAGTRLRWVPPGWTVWVTLSFTMQQVRPAGADDPGWIGSDDPVIRHASYVVRHPSCVIRHPSFFSGFGFLTEEGKKEGSFLLRFFC